jgi:hypothetical protein
MRTLNKLKWKSMGSNEGYYPLYPGLLGKGRFLRG